MVFCRLRYHAHTQHLMNPVLAKEWHMLKAELHDRY